MNIDEAYTDKDYEDYFTLKIDIRMNIHEAYTDKDCDCEDYFTLHVHIPQGLK